MLCECRCQEILICQMSFNRAMNIWELSLKMWISTVFTNAQACCWSGLHCQFPLGFIIILMVIIKEQLQCAKPCIRFHIQYFYYVCVCFKMIENKGSWNLDKRCKGITYMWLQRRAGTILHGRIMFDIRHSPTGEMNMLQQLDDYVNANWDLLFCLSYSGRNLMWLLLPLQC